VFSRHAPGHGESGVKPGLIMMASSVAPMRGLNLFSGFTQDFRPGLLSAAPAWADFCPANIGRHPSGCGDVTISRARAPTPHRQGQNRGQEVGVALARRVGFNEVNNRVDQRRDAADHQSDRLALRFELDRP